MRHLLRERRDRRRWLAKREVERPVEQLAAEAALFLEDPDPPVLPWPGGIIEVGSPDPYIVPIFSEFGDARPCPRRGITAGQDTSRHRQTSPRRRSMIVVEAFKRALSRIFS